MYENDTWEEISQMLRDKTFELGRVPQKKEIECSDELNTGFIGGWPYVLAYAGIYPRAGEKKRSRFPTLIEDFTDEQIISIIRTKAWKIGRTPWEKDTWLFPEIMKRWPNWTEAMLACGMELPYCYKPSSAVSRRPPRDGSPMPLWRKQLLAGARTGTVAKIKVRPKTGVWHAPDF